MPRVAVLILGLVWAVGCRAPAPSAPRPLTTEEKKKHMEGLERARQAESGARPG